MKGFKMYHIRQKGSMNTGGILVMSIAMIFLAVGFIIFPIATTATDSLLDYTYSSFTSITASTYTGFTSIIGITPLLILVGFVAAAVVTGFLGIKIMKAGGSTRMEPGNFILMALAIIFIAIALVIMPVTLDGVSANLAHREPQSDVSTNVTTAVGVAAGNVTLTQTLYNSAVSEVTSVSSNISETPVADNYTSPRLFLTGLTANTTRTITTLYNYADIYAGGGYTGMSSFLLVVPLLVHIALLVAAVFSGFFGIRSIARST